MSDKAGVPTTPRKSGPTPKGWKIYTVMLPPDLADWAKAREEGLSGLLRRLLREESERLKARRPGA